MSSLNEFATAAKRIRQSLEQEIREQDGFIAYAKETGSGFFEPPISTELPISKDIAAFESTIAELTARINRSEPDGIDMRGGSSSDRFPCKLSFPVPFELALSGKGQATASFSITGELGLLNFKSDATDSITFDKHTIAADRSPPSRASSPSNAGPHAGVQVDKGKGKQRAIVPSDDDSSGASAATLENSSPPASHIEQDARLAAALQKDEWELADATHAASVAPGHADVPAPASSHSPSPMVGPSAGAMDVVPASYADIKPHHYVWPVLDALPEDGKTAHGLYAVLNAAKHHQRKDQTLEQAVEAYLGTFNEKTPEEKHATINALCKYTDKHLPRPLAKLNQTMKTYLSETDVHELLEDFATTVGKTPTKNTQAQKPSKDIAHKTAIAHFTKTIFPPGPFLSDYIAARGRNDEKKIDAVFYIDSALSKRKDISLRDFLGGKDTKKAIELVHSLQTDTSSTRAKKALAEWRRDRYPLQIDQVLERAIAERYRTKNIPEQLAQLALSLPMYKVLNGLSDTELISQLRNKSVFNPQLAKVLNTTTEVLLRSYRSAAVQIASSDAIENYLTALHATTQTLPDKLGETATVTDTSSDHDASGNKVPPTKRQRLR